MLESIGLEDKLSYFAASLDNELYAFVWLFATKDLI
jgi:hypothetical protein